MAESVGVQRWAVRGAGAKLHLDAVVRSPPPSARLLCTLRQRSQPLRLRATAAHYLLYLHLPLPSPCTCHHLSIDLHLHASSLHYPSIVAPAQPQPSPARSLATPRSSRRTVAHAPPSTRPYYPRPPRLAQSVADRSIAPKRGVGCVGKGLAMARCGARRWLVRGRLARGHVCASGAGIGYFEGVGAEGGGCDWAMGGGCTGCCGLDE